MWRSKATAASGHESNRATGQKTDQTVNINLIFQSNMVMHERGQSSKPSRRSTDLTAPSVINANEASRRRRMHLASELFDVRQGSSCGRISAAREHNYVGLTDSLARP